VTNFLFGLFLRRDVAIDGDHFAHRQAEEVVFAPTGLLARAVDGHRVEFGHAGLPDATKTVEQTHVAHAGEDLGDPPPEQCFFFNAFDFFRGAVEVDKHEILTVIDDAVHGDAQSAVVEKRPVASFPRRDALHHLLELRQVAGHADVDRLRFPRKL